MATRNWPHPVLDAQSGDYPNCAFQARLEIKQTKLDYNVRAEFDLGCDSLEKAIEAGNAEFVLQVSCARTAYRQIFVASVHALNISIPEHDLRDIFVVAPYIVAKTEFQLRSDELAATFAELKFTVKAGAVLGVAPVADYVAEKVFDELKSISAIFQVIKQTDQKKDVVEYDMNGNKIAIALPHKAYEDYCMFRARPPYREMFVCSLVLPGLAAAIEALGPSEPESFESLRWRRVLRRRLKEVGRTEFNRDESFKISQELLEFPYGRAFQAIKVKESDES